MIDSLPDPTMKPVEFDAPETQSDSCFADNMVAADVARGVGRRRIRGRGDGGFRAA